jgi:hypothetical protein
VEQAIKNQDKSNLIWEMATEQASISIFICCHCCHVLKKCSFKHFRGAQANASQRLNEQIGKNKAYIAKTFLAVENQKTVLAD